MRARSHLHYFCSASLPMLQTRLNVGVLAAGHDHLLGTLFRLWHQLRLGACRQFTKKQKAAKTAADKAEKAVRVCSQCESTASYRTASYRMHNSMRNEV